MILLKRCLATLLMATLALAPCTISGCHIVQVIKAKHCKKAPPLPSPVRTVTVAGEVRHPGVLEFPQYGGLTIQKAIANSGGMAPESLMLATPTTEDPAANGYSDYLKSRVVTLVRNEVTYVLPAEIIDSTEFGRIRLAEHDIVAVVDLKVLGLKGTDGKDPLAGSNPIDTVTINGTTKLEQTEFTDAQLQSQFQLRFGQTIESYTSILTENVKKFVDLEKGPSTLRLTRHVTADGLPQVFLIPITNGVATSLKSEILVRGGDSLTYLPPGLDPLVLTSSIAEAQTRDAIERLRGHLSVSRGYAY